MLIDSHCHFNSLSRITREEIISSKPEFLLIDSGIDLDSSLASISLSRKYDFIHTSLGFHPFCANEFSDEVLSRYRKLIEDGEKIVGIGEIGLDYKANTPADKQEEIFSKFLELARDKNLAVIIHNRTDPSKKSLPRVFEVIDRHLADYQKVIFHCFSYSPDILDKIIEKKGFVSFSLNILRKKKDIIESLKRCPLANLLLETDSPYMRIGDKKSTPLDIGKVYSYVSYIKEIDQEVIEKEVYSNAKKVFSLEGIKKF